MHTPFQTTTAIRARASTLTGILLTTEVILGIAAFLLYTVLAAGAVRVYNLEMGDAVARTANAAYVVLSRNPHYGAIGTVWPPLTSTLQVPLVWLLALAGHPPQFAGNLLSALAGAATLVVLYRLFRTLALPSRWRWVLLALYAGNPMVLFYAINGMSESLFILWLVLALYGVVRWWQTGRPGHLGTTGVAMSAAFLTRYEALALAGAMALMLGYDLYRREIDHPWVRLTLFATPLFYTVLAWLGFNFLTMKNPFYFLQNPYADFTSLNVSVSPEQRGLIAQLSSSVVTTLTYSGFRVAALFPPALPLAGLALWHEWRESHERLSLLLVLPVLSFAIVVFDTILLFLGLLPTGLRFYLHLIPFTVILFAVLATRFPERYARPAWLIVLLAGSLVTLGIMARPAISPQDAAFIAAVRNGTPMDRFAEEEAVSQYLREQVPANARILIDTQHGFPIVLRSPDPARFVIPSDVDYDEIVARPTGRVDYVLVQDPHGYGWSDLMNRRHPTLYDDNWPYARLLHDFGGDTEWRLFRIHDGGNDE